MHFLFLNSLVYTGWLKMVWYISIFNDPQNNEDINNPMSFMHRVTHLYYFYTLNISTLVFSFFLALQRFMCGMDLCTTLYFLALFFYWKDITDIYLGMLDNCISLQPEELPLHVFLQQDGAPPDWRTIVRSFLNEHFTGNELVQFLGHPIHLI